MKKFKANLLLTTLTLFALCQLAAVRSNGQAGKCLVISDIHFNPFYTSDGSYAIDTQLRDELALSPVEYWQSILDAYFKKGGAKPLDGLKRGYDSNYPLLVSAIDAMAKQVSRPRFIIIAGDFLWHQYYGHTNDTVAFALPGQQRALKDSTIKFIAYLFKSKFPGTAFIPALGNNDTGGDDYSKQGQDFLHHFALAWNLAKLNVDTAKYDRTGYFVAETSKASDPKIVVLNSSLISNKKRDAYQKDARQMFDWLDNVLSQPDNKNVWVISHIPPGADLYPDYNAKLLNKITTSPNVKYYIAGHTHFNDFRVIYDEKAAKVYPLIIRIVPSIGSNHDNSPSFEVAEIGKDYTLTKETNYVLNSETAMTDPASAQWLAGYSINTVGLSAITAQAMYDFMQHKNPNNCQPYYRFHSLDDQNRDSYLKKVSDFNNNILRIGQ
ncbi:MAG: metallophosphoesterase [Bacteroidetes bacterium]|nr:metallophosphoesterase [Bacteroidota bacterium]